MQTLGKPSCEVPANYGKRLWQQRCKGGYPYARLQPLHQQVTDASALDGE